MEHLAKHDFRTILTAVEYLEADCDLARFPERAIAALGVAVTFDLASYNELDPVRGRNRFLVVPDTLAARPNSSEYDAFHHFMHQHPLVGYYSASADRTPRKISDFLTDHQFRSLGLYSDFFRVLDTNYQIIVMINDGPGTLVAVALNRRDRDFDEGERARLSVLRFHIVRHYRTALRLASMMPLLHQGSFGASAPITRRELEVLAQVALGKTNDEIAAVIGARPMTVKKHLEHIYHKLGCRNRTAAARWMALSFKPTVPNLR